MQIQVGYFHMDESFWGVKKHWESKLRDQGIFMTKGTLRSNPSVQCFISYYWPWSWEFSERLKAEKLPDLESALFKWVPSAPFVSMTPSFWVVSFVMILSYDLGLSLTQIESLEFCPLDLLPSWSCSLSHCARTEETWSNLVDVASTLRQPTD